MSRHNLHSVLSTACATWAIGLPLALFGLGTILGMLSWLLDLLPR